MITLLNFGDSPFKFLFILVMTVFLLTLAANVIALIMTLVISSRTNKLRRKFRGQQ